MEREDSFSERELQNRIRLELSQLGWVTFHINVGCGFTPDGRWFDTGAPKGFSDLLCIRDGRAVFIEVKVRPNKPTKEQLNFIAQMRRLGCSAGVAYSLEEAFAIAGGRNDAEKA